MNPIDRFDDRKRKPVLRQDSIEDEVPFWLWFILFWIGLFFFPLAPFIWLSCRKNLFWADIGFLITCVVWIAVFISILNSEFDFGVVLQA